MTEGKKENTVLIERLKSIQNDFAESEVRRGEVEGQLRQSHTVRQTIDSLERSYILYNM